MKIAIVGFDVDGRASYDYYAARGHEITICDQQADKPVPQAAASQLGDDYLRGLDRFDMILRTSGINPQKIVAANPGVGAKITTQINEFLKLSPTGNIIAVTGTKGKGTTSSLIARMLEADGKTAYLGGNIGVPPFTFIDALDAGSWVVLELSSFQLVDFDQAPHIALCLMMAPEHVDWHGNLEAYYTAKEQLFARQGTADIAIYYHQDPVSKRIAGAGQAQKLPYYHAPGAEVIDGSIVIDGTVICQTDELMLLGQHNWQNACAAVTAMWYACLQTCGPSQQPDIRPIRQALTSFSGLPYRIEFRSEVNGIRYYNDSFSSAPPAPLAAVAAVPGKQVLILGGFDRQLDLAGLAQGLAAHADKLRTVVIIGQAGPRLAENLHQQGFDNYVIEPAATMSQIVATATALAHTGDAVVLSPGFPSFDMFQNFKDRGDQFNSAVAAL